MPCLQILTSLSFFWFLANLELSGSRIPDVRTCKSYLFVYSNLLRKLETVLKISNTAATLLLWVNVLFMPKNADFLQEKHNDISKINKALVPKGVFSETTYICLLMYQIASY